MTNSDVQPIDQRISFSENSKNSFNPMIDGIRWSERYSPKIEQIWKYIPNWLRKVFVFFAIFLLASGIQGSILTKKVS